MLNETKFWAMIEQSRSGAVKRGLKGDDVLDDQEKVLAAELGKLSPEEIVDFNERFYELHASAYVWKLWGAAYWLGGGCGNDGFTDFRATLISLGEKRFKQAVNDPDSLAEIVGQPDVPYLQGEGFQYVAGNAYKKKTGKEIPLGKSSRRKDPLGEKWDFDDFDETEERLPKLVEKFPEMGD